jgi:hypothetical protein
MMSKSVDSVYLAQNTGQWQTRLNVVTKFQDP